MNNQAESAINEVFSLYLKYGSADYIGEPVSQLEHMSQAAQHAMRQGCDDEIILAAFFHDIGHICVMRDEENDMNGLGTRNHEKTGADFLRAKGFPERIAKLVENHVQAKRYLTYKFPDYYNDLSEASKETLKFQGGKMTPEESALFEEDPLFTISLLLRKWDESAKEMHTPVIDLELIKQKARKILMANLIAH